MLQTTKFILTPFNKQLYWAFFNITIVIGEPIWVTYAQQKGPNTVGCMFWGGCEHKIKDVLIDHRLNYSKTSPFEKRVDQAIDWFANDGLEVIMMYHYEVSKSSIPYNLTRNAPALHA